MSSEFWEKEVKPPSLDSIPDDVNLHLARNRM